MRGREEASNNTIGGPAFRRKSRENVTQNPSQNRTSIVPLEYICSTQNTLDVGPGRKKSLLIDTLLWHLPAQNRHKRRTQGGLPYTMPFVSASLTYPVQGLELGLGQARPDRRTLGIQQGLQETCTDVPPHVGIVSRRGSRLPLRAGEASPLSPTGGRNVIAAGLRGREKMRRRCISRRGFGCVHGGLSLRPKTVKVRGYCRGFTGREGL